MAKKRSFEEALVRLEEIVLILEQGDTPLEEAIEVFDEGMQLASQCARQLEDAERKLKKLVKSESGFQLELLGTDAEEF
ncbi:MAG: exodeoxyribonuclease VII small subunit [Deferribacteres bacterium]|nr:exodeoxyribonuclease VII small subunit [candidate division KSB1 bacterium]MCB9509264.1 exodeoxyribonuclease VII small subunit [Deferribacteres bacterium]